MVVRHRQTGLVRNTQSVAVMEHKNSAAALFMLKIVNRIGLSEFPKNLPGNFKFSW